MDLDRRPDLGRDGGWTGLALLVRRRGSRRARTAGPAPSAPGPVKTSSRKAQQNIAEASPLFWIGNSASGWWTLKYAYAIEPEAMNAALRVPRPSSTRAPPTSSITAAYQPGQVPAEVPPVPVAPPSTPKSERGAVAGEEQADDDAEQAEHVRLGVVEPGGQ